MSSLKRLGRWASGTIKSTTSFLDKTAQGVSDISKTINDGLDNAKKRIDDLTPTVKTDVNLSKSLWIALGVAAIFFVLKIFKIIK